MLPAVDIQFHRLILSKVCEAMLNFLNTATFLERQLYCEYKPKYQCWAPCWFC